jgi:biopolymer transport protein ExbD
MAIIRGREKKGDVEIFTASMADIVFLLIVFFVLTYKVEVDRTRVDLPETWVRSEVPKKAAVVSISSPAEGQIIRVSSGEEIALPVNSDEEIVTFASTVVAKDPTKEFIVKADEGVRYEKVDVVLDALKQSNVKIIYLLSDQKTVDG